MKHLLFLILPILYLPLKAQHYNYRDPAIDVLHYTFDITLNDENNVISADALIRFRILQASDKITFDLVKQKDNGKGMLVTSVMTGNTKTSFEHTANKLTIKLPFVANKNDQLEARIMYSGIPEDGLIISTNKYKKRTFFSDNWPNRAHNWLVSIDHPSDKASVDWSITAPEHYQIISNGIHVEESTLPGKQKRTRYSENVPLPTKVMVIGLADFSVQHLGEVDCIPLTSWVYMEERERGTIDYHAATEILPFFIKHIGPYPYRKLANVQSKTVFGGMENASAIFYFENSVTGKGKKEPLIAHEIAHQWFGNMATEIHWSHLWLSEGFATYFSALYMQSKYGSDTLLSIMKEDRTKVVQYFNKRKTPVVDTAVVNYMDMLNTNSYDKASWVLHMLKSDMGDSTFMRTIRNYYRQFAGKNAGTEDFRKIAEETAGKNYEQFFTQWLYTPGHPVLDISWSYNAIKKQVLIEVIQKQETTFHFPLEFEIISTNGKPVRKTFILKEKNTVLRIPADEKPSKVIVDPDVKLLFDGKLSAQ